MPRCLVALGSNLGDRAHAIAAAIERLAGLDAVSGLRASRIRETRPIGGPPGQSPYLNAAASFDTSLTPEALHAALVEIETALGRRRGERWAARTVDLDLLLYGDVVVDTPRLTVPHPRMAFRRFVLEPSVDVAAEMNHATIGWSVARLLEHLEKAVPYISLLGVPGTGKTALAQQLSAAFSGQFLADPAADAAASRPLEPSTGAASPAYAREIEFLALRASLLDKRQWPAGEVLAVSDFYFEQSLAYAELVLAADELGLLAEALVAAGRQVVLPKLLVVLDTPPASRARAEQTTPDHAVFGRRSPAADRTERLREKLLGLAARRGVGPVLFAGAWDAQAQFAEVSAAIEAMQTRSEAT